MKNIILIAPPAAGKGTQCALLKEKYGYVHISTGDLLRAIDPTSELGKKVNEIMNAGALVGDDIIFELIEERLSHPDVKNGFVLDGFPRNINQAKTYMQLCKKLNIDMGIAIYISISKEMAMQRALGRLGCPICNKPYHKFNPQAMPKTSGICDECGVELISRDDDNEETFTTRFNTYINNTQPLIDFFQGLNSLTTIMAHDDKMVVMEEIERVINDGED